MHMDRTRPTRGPRDQFPRNSFSLCRYAPPASNSSPMPRSNSFRCNTFPTGLFRIGSPHPRYKLFRMRGLCKYPPTKPFIISRLCKLRGEGVGGQGGYGPGASLTDWTGGIPDTVEPVASACRTGTCHGKRAVLWNRSFDSSLSTNRAIEP